MTVRPLWQVRQDSLEGVRAEAPDVEAAATRNGQRLPRLVEGARQHEAVGAASER